MRKEIAMALATLRNANFVADMAIETIVTPFGAEGVTLNTFPYIMGNVLPNGTKRVLKLRNLPATEGLQMLLEGEDKWQPMSIDDKTYLLEELSRIVDGEI
jgi:hypothetical protein